MPCPENIIPPKKGEVRNPKGKPKGTKNRSTILKRWIKTRVTIKDKSNPTLKDVKGTVEDQIVLALIGKALKGDVQAIKEINDTLYGKIHEELDHTLNISDGQLSKEERELRIAALKKKINAD